MYLRTIHLRLAHAGSVTGTGPIRPVSTNLEEAVSWGLVRARTIIVRTLGIVFYWAGDRPTDWTADRGEMRRWPPSASERRQIDDDYSSAVAAAQEEEATYRAYVQARELWLGSHASELAGLDPVHECLLMLPGPPESEAAFEELDPDGHICGALTQDGQFAFGSTEEVIATITGLPTHNPWIGAVCRALDRERGWDRARRSIVGVGQSEGEMFHVTAAQNRASILRHGLDWRRMAATHGIAGSREPELPVVFLCDSWGDVSFFTAMARTPSDVWGVRVDGLWTEPGPDGWTIIDETVPPERLRLVEHDLPVTRHR